MPKLSLVETMREITTAVVLLSLSWTSVGGPAFADSCLAQRDPKAYLSQRIDDPRLALSPEDKARLRAAVGRERAITSPAPRPVQRVHAERRAAARLGELSESLRKDAGTLDARRIEGYLEQVRAAHRDILRGFDRVQGLIQRHQLPDTIQTRHEAARTRYLAKMGGVLQALEAAAVAKEPAAVRAHLEAAERQLRGSTAERPYRPFRPEEIDAQFSKKPARAPRIADPQSSAGRASHKAHRPPGPEDLAPDEDVQITPEIEALAAELDHQPRAIYNWVRNHIEFIPTHGAVQGSRMTLEARRGNAYDTAALLISLLRASQIPARFATGTVEVPVDRARSWLHGAADSGVAQDILGQGRIPNVGLIKDGVVTHLRLEHVWVEAWIDYLPGRGATHEEGDTWIPLDASFKLHEVIPPASVFAALPLADALLPSVPPEALFTLDEALGKITAVDEEPLELALTDWVLAADEYLLEHPEEQSPDVLIGGPRILEEASTVLPASLPYRVLDQNLQQAALPDSLRHRVTLRGPGFAIPLSLPRINSQRLRLHFAPATAADAAVLAAARAEGAPSLPVYLVNVVPVVTLDEEVLFQGGQGEAVGMGTLYWLDVVLHAPEQNFTAEFDLIAGDEAVIGITGSGITREVLEKRLATHPVEGPPEYFNQVQLHYWMELDFLGEVASRGAGTHYLRHPSAGIFSSPLEVSFLFGAPLSGAYQGKAMDVNLLLGAAGEDDERVRAFVRQVGLMASFLEGGVFDQLANLPLPRFRGYSAVQVISTAAVLDIPIYYITSATAATVLPLLSVKEPVEEEIRSALARGLTVLVPEREVDLGLWSGSGYIITDEETGAGVYKISGGRNGGGLLDCLEQLDPFFDPIQVILFLSIILLLLLILGLALLGPEAVVVGAAAAVVFFVFIVVKETIGPSTALA